MQIHAHLGLACAIAVLTSCGPSKLDDGDAMCTVENYDDHPGMLKYAEVECVPTEPDGSCAECDLECMEAIVEGCGGGLCGSHALLCSEQLGDQCCHLVTAAYAGDVGRPLREHGEPLLPALAVRGPSSSDPERAEAAAVYRDFARYERASVDAFLHTAAVLERLGAPADMISQHLDAACEEADHARLALLVAQALDGRDAELGELPSSSPSFDLTVFVRELIHDGCIGELFAAREAEWALQRIPVDANQALSRYWERVANDEAGHAALAWRTLEWLLARQPELGTWVATELARAMASRARPRDTDAEELGIASSTIQATLRDQTLRELLASARDVINASA